MSSASRIIKDGGRLAADDSIGSTTTKAKRIAGSILMLMQIGSSTVRLKAIAIVELFIVKNT